MAWFQVDDQLAMHRKACEAGNAAMGLWVRAGSWSMANLTEGFVPKSAAKTLGTAGQAKALVAAGLWVEIDGGYQFHEWDTRQMSAEQIADRRRKRAEAGRKGGQSRGGGKGKPEANAQASAQAKPEQNSTPVPVPTQEELSHPEYESAPNVGGDERGLSAPVRPSASRLVQEIVGDATNGYAPAVLSKLRIHTSQIVADVGLEVAAETLRIWKTKPHLGADALPALTAEAAKVIAERNHGGAPTNGHDAKVNDFLAFASRPSRLELEQ